MINKQWLFAFSLFFLLACAERKDLSGQPPKKALNFFDQGYKAYSYGEYEDAESWFKQAINKHPKYTDAHDALAKTYQVQQKYPEAIRSYRKVLEINPAHYFALYELGNTYFSLEQLDSSHYFFSQFLRVVTTNDKYTNRAQQKVDNIEFAKQAMANPSNIEPINIGAKINTNLEEYSPALTIDGNSLFFTSRDGKQHISRQNEDIYFSNRINGQWSQAQPIGPPINTVENEGAFSVTADGRYIFFTSCNRPGGKGQCDIWITMNKGKEWSNPMNLGNPINSKNWESQPSISADGRYLYFTSNRPGGYGGTDLYVSTFTDSGWSVPENLGPEINTPEDEQFPFIHPDGNTLYFSSYGLPGMGESDLYVTHLKPDRTFSKPLNLGYPINSLGQDWNLIVARDGKTAYYSTDKRKDGYGGMDIYSFQLPKAYQAKQVSYLKGFVFDEKTKKELGATIELIPLNEDATTNTFAPEGSGIFVVSLRPNLRYALHVQREGYLFYSDYFDMPPTPDDQPYELKIPLKAIEEGSSIVLKNVFFDTDKYILKPESNIELQKLITFLSKNSSVSIEISGHTDNVGSASHNLSLSSNRALAVYNYLVENGIEKSRLSYRGYGDTRPIADNNSEEGRAMNRRTEFKVKE